MEGINNDGEVGAEVKTAEGWLRIGFQDTKCLLPGCLQIAMFLELPILYTVFQFFAVLQCLCSLRVYHSCYCRVTDALLVKDVNFNLSFVLHSTDQYPGPLVCVNLKKQKLPKCPSWPFWSLLAVSLRLLLSLAARRVRLFAGFQFRMSKGMKGDFVPVHYGEVKKRGQK